MGILAITEDLEDAMRRERAGTTPMEIVQARIDIAMCKWAMAHDNAEAFYGEPDWYTRRRP